VGLFKNDCTIGYNSRRRISRHRSLFHGLYDLFSTHGQRLKTVISHSDIQEYRGLRNGKLMFLLCGGGFVKFSQADLFIRKVAELIGVLPDLTESMRTTPKQVIHWVKEQGYELWGQSRKGDFKRISNPVMDQILKE
jgi:hypothetical protein